MRMLLVAALAAGWLGAAVPLLAPRAAAAQQREWNDARTIELVRRAIGVRAVQLADTALRDFKAKAHGYVTFLAQVGEGFTEPPRVVKADEIAVEVYWGAPDRSKQVLVGRRDSTLLPTDISYHRDHLAVILNNFPSIIRLGDGDEVQDVAHPLSEAGLATYDYAIVDSLTLRLGPGRTIDVIQVRVRPKDPSRPAAVGAVFLDRQEAQVARMSFSFTRAALKDRQLEDVSVVLDNGLVDGRFWLPRRQTIEIRRTGTWLDFPVRGIIRGRWEVCCVETNVGIEDRMLSGPEIVSVGPAQLRAYPFGGAILDSLPPDVRAPTDEETRAVQEEARRLVRQEALQRARSTALTARGVSDFVRVNRVEGLALGAGLTRRLGRGVFLGGSARWGVDDEELKWTLGLGVRRASGAGVSLDVHRRYAEAGDEVERSGAVNSFAAQEFGSDYTDPYDARGLTVTADLAPWRGVRWSAGLTAERQGALGIVAAPSRGRYERTIPATALDELRLVLAAERPTALAVLGSELRARVEARVGVTRLEGSDSLWQRPYLRLHHAATAERPFGRQRLALRWQGGALLAADGRHAPQQLLYAGGPVSAPGYLFHEIAGTATGALRAEWRAPAPFVPIPLGRFGRAPGSVTLAPFVSLAGTNGRGAFAYDPSSSLPRAPRRGLFPSVGLGGLFLFDLLRVDVARGLRGGVWMLNVDVDPSFWRVL